MSEINRAIVQAHLTKLVQQSNAKLETGQSNIRLSLLRDLLVDHLHLSSNVAPFTLVISVYMHGEHTEEATVRARVEMRDGCEEDAENAPMVDLPVMQIDLNDEHTSHLLLLALGTRNPFKAMQYLFGFSRQSTI